MRAMFLCRTGNFGRMQLTRLRSGRACRRAQGSCQVNQVPVTTELLCQLNRFDRSRGCRLGEAVLTLAAILLAVQLLLLRRGLFFFRFRSFTAAGFGLWLL